MQSQGITKAPRSLYYSPVDNRPSGNVNIDKKPWGTTINTGPGDDKVHAHTHRDGSVTVTINGEKFQFSLAEASKLTFNLGDGNDTFTTSKDKPGWNKSVGLNVGFTVNGGRGNDSLTGGAGNDRLNGGAGNDYINGGDGDDQIKGQSGNDTLFGGDDNDSINGGSGNDYVNGGKGHDSLYGGSGDDDIHGDRG